MTHYGLSMIFATQDHLLNPCYQLILLLENDEFFRGKCYLWEAVYSRQVWELYHIPLLCVSLSPPPHPKGEQSHNPSHKIAFCFTAGGKEVIKSLVSRLTDWGTWNIIKQKSLGQGILLQQWEVWYSPYHILPRFHNSLMTTSALGQTQMTSWHRLWQTQLSKTPGPNRRKNFWEMKLRHSVEEY